ncbi:50S ribosome-binding GTPase [Gluconobacter kondonii]|uniref:GTPase n=1 Tax=Gluconobacter kondonii TaxID=941463 RepID=UPI001B8AB230|nr:GTPase [Gluconobacter kondonii]MBS1078263.1 50S ribosome-binding GTPase [Gluconobacter kondonii]
MATPEFAPILDTFSRVRPLIDRWLGGDASSEMAAALEEKSKTDRPRIMVYGVYNAGKSTLLNALIGEDRAAMADWPETAVVKGYDWHGYTLLDTPGIDAPIEHEKVTEESLNRSDVVLMVVSTGGVAAESATWEALTDLVSRGRRVMVVLNDKMGLEPGSTDYLTAISSAQALMQEAAEKAGVKDIVEKVDICIVNARRALKGRMENKPTLLKKSGLEELEKKLFAFFEQCDFADVCRSAARDVLGLINRTATAMEEKAGDDESRSVEELAQAVSKSREQTILKARSRLENIVQNSRSRVVSFCRSKAENPDMPDDELGAITTRMVDNLATFLEDTLAEEFQNLDQDVEKVARFAAKGRAGGGTINIDPMEGRTGNGYSQHFSKLGESLGEGIKAVDPEHMTSAFKSMLMFGKDLSKTDMGKFLKPLFHGKGVVKLGNTASKISKGIGPALSVLTSAVSIGMAIKEDIAERRALERLAKAIDDAAATYLAEFKDEADGWVTEHVKSVFSNLDKSVKERQKEVFSENAALRKDREILTEAKLALADY